MKKVSLMLIAAFLTAVTVIGCSSNDTPEVTVINPSHKTSPAAVFAFAFRDALGDAKFYQSEDCEDAGRKYRETPNAVFIYNSSMEFAGRNKGLNCNLEPLTDKKIVFVGQHYFKLCRRAGDTVDLVPGNNRRVTMGIASMLATQAHENTWKEQGVNVKIVPYSGSKTVAKALLAGDIDIGFMGQGIAAKQGDRIECLYSTNPEADNYLGKSIPVAVPDFHISFVVYTNSKDPKVLEKLRNVGNSEVFNNYLKKSMTQGTFDVTQDSGQTAIEYVRRLYKNWADR